MAFCLWLVEPEDRLPRISDPLHGLKRGIADLAAASDRRSLMMRDTREYFLSAPLG
jgi:hypothetical protein